MSSMSIRAKLIGLLALLSLVIFTTTFIAWKTGDSSNDTLRLMHDGHIVPMRDLKTIADAYAVSIVDTAHKVRAGTLSWEQGTASVASAKAQVDKLWAGFTASEKSAEEKRLIERTEAAMANANQSLVDLKGIMSRQDQAALESFVSTRLYPSIDPISDAVTALMTFQISQAAQLDTQASQDIGRAAMIEGVMLIVGLLAVIAGWYVITRSVVAPIGSMTDAMRRIAGGDTSITVPALDQRNEIGAMAASLQVFKDSLIESERLTAERLEAEQRERVAEERRLKDIAERDAAAYAREEQQRQEAEESRRAMMQQLAGQFEANVGSIVSTIASAAVEMRASSESMVSIASENALKSNTVAAASQQASANVQTVAAAGEELASSVDEIRRQMEQSRKVADRAATEADNSTNKVRGLVEAAQEIGAVVQLINEIAEQTNLLALNATIEAARAGEAGKGFAVVASEVKTLATQTTSATNQIAAKIEQVRNATEDAASAIQVIGTIIAEMNEISTAIAAAVDEQGATTREIARSVQEAAIGTQNVTGNIAAISAGAETTGESAQGVLGAADELARQSEHLRSQVEAFLDRVRAA